MERRISGKIDAHTIAFKDDVSSKIREVNAAMTAALSKQDQEDQQQQQNQLQIDMLCKQLISFVYDYEKLKLCKEDFMTVADKVINELFHANMMIE